MLRSSAASVARRRGSQAVIEVFNAMDSYSARRAPTHSAFPTVAVLAGVVLLAGCSRTSSTDEAQSAAQPPAAPAAQDERGLDAPVAGTSGNENAVAGAVPGKLSTSTDAVAQGGGTAAPNAATATPTTGNAPSASVGTGAAATWTVQVKMEPRSGSTAAGTVTLREAEGRLVAQVALTGLNPNAEHGFHVHEKGDSSAPDAASAGAHFNPGNTRHGRPGGNEYHAGDLPNLKTDATGTARVEIPVTSLTLAGGATSIAGRSLVVHRNADDYQSQPAGNSGDRVACGVIPARG